MTRNSHVGCGRGPLRATRRSMLLVLASASSLTAAVAVAETPGPSTSWTATERALIDSLRIEHLGPAPPSPGNRYADSTAAAALGEKIFNDPRFSANGKVSCAHCHRAAYNFTDDLPQAIGLELTTRRSMPAIGMAYQRWYFWDGRADSLWAQALGPLENPLEHGISRTRVAQLIFSHYRADYREAIGPLPKLNSASLPASAAPAANSAARSRWLALPAAEREQITRIFVNTGKAIAAFVRTLVPEPTAFDHYARALEQSDQRGLNNLTAAQQRGLRLFIGKGGCINCHNGPLFSNGEFHHVGTPDANQPDRGRAAVIDTIRHNEFGCASRWSDSDLARDCAHVRYLDIDVARYERAFKTPSLRDVAVRSPYMHAGQFQTLAGVLRHYREASGKGAADEIFHGQLQDRELEQLDAFLHALTTHTR